MKAESIRFELELTYVPFRLPSTRSSNPSSSRSLGIVLSNVNLFKNMYGHDGVYGYETGETAERDGRVRRARVGAEDCAGRNESACGRSHARVTRAALVDSARGHSTQTARDGIRTRAGELGPRTPPQLASSYAKTERSVFTHAHAHARARHPRRVRIRCRVRPRENESAYAASLHVCVDSTRTASAPSAVEAAQPGPGARSTQVDIDSAGGEGAHEGVRRAETIGTKERMQ
ncbi:hypothetical protein C8F04DRAFT_1310746 [Mycena alexandri]|uniref:Uncharacterized protein n=1 Tax=Mycena alexandri TaxID=1745969 RepID=A0AAD6WVE1_9AGAR|nr:hypothetical protein C8F04DRAFT_1310746 [Mycena alexandri]